MLEPHARTLLFDVLRPPDDYSLDYAIATTFTLDLLALLTAPVAFTLFEADDHRDLLQANSLTLLESLRRYADRLSVFTQAGHISLPKARFPQLEFLENAVIECRVNTGLFHPKVWVLRFAGPQGAVRYRFACLSRNLTFDRCWDTTLTLEGPLRDRRNGFAANRPLLEFLQALPAMSVHALGSEATDRIRQFADELARVEFELPEGFTEFRFHPLGISPRRRLPFEDVGGRMLAVSPFISEDGLKRIMAGRPGSLLVTREDSLARVGLGVPEIARCYVMRDVVETDGAGLDEEEPPTARGLHAKCYIAESGWNAHVWTGSANATSAGFNGNVEFLVELIGLKSRVGIDALFDEEAGKTSFGDMLDPVSPPDHPETDDSDERAFASAVDRVRDALIARVSLEVEEADTGFRLSLRASQPLDLPGDLQVTCWPATLGEGYAVTVQAGSRMPEFSVSLEGITAFMAFKAASP
ncbi:MAG: phospholipase D family protein, partial [Vicinamibacterales bacterium]